MDWILDDSHIPPTNVLWGNIVLNFSLVISLIRLISSPSLALKLPRTGKTTHTYTDLCIDVVASCLFKFVKPGGRGKVRGQFWSSTWKGPKASALGLWALQCISKLWLGLHLNFWGNALHCARRAPDQRRERAKKKRERESEREREEESAFLHFLHFKAASTDVYMAITVSLVLNQVYPPSTEPPTSSLLFHFLSRADLPVHWHSIKITTSSS